MPLSDRFQHYNRTVESAYAICRDTEQSILNALDLATNKKERTVESKRLINIRILGHLLTRGSSDTAIAYITSSIVSCELDAQKLDLLGDFYYKHFIRTCNSLFSSKVLCDSTLLTKPTDLVRGLKGATPASSGHASRPSFDFRRALICDELTGNFQQYMYPHSHKQAKKSVRIHVLSMLC